MKIVVTGATGFIGQHVVQALLQRCVAADIFCVVRSPGKAVPLRKLGVRLCQADLKDGAALKEVCRSADFIFHLAAKVKFGMGKKYLIDFDTDNVAGTLNMLKAAPEGLRRFVHMSSVNAVERAWNDTCSKPLDENDACAPSTAYGLSKFRAEEAVRASKIPYLILRPPSLVYGPGCHPESGMARLIRMVESRALTAGINFPGRFSLIHVKDLARETVRLAFSNDLVNETLFVSDEPPRTMLEVNEAIARALASTLRRISLPRPLYGLAKALLQAAAKQPALGKRIPFQLWMLLRDQSAVSSAKARGLAGFETRIPIEAGIKETISWLKEGRHD